MGRQTRVLCRMMSVCVLCWALTGPLAAHRTAACGVTSDSPAAPGRSPSPDVIMVIVDDLNDGIQLLDPQGPVRTPHLNRLARRGVSFRRAYCVSPACNPSRVATLTGLRPATSGVYGNASDWRRALPDRLTITQQFRKAGYYVAGAGKVFHHHLNGAFHDAASFDQFTPMKPQQYPATKLNRAPEYGSRNTDWGQWPARDEQTIDHQTVTRCIDVLQQHDTAQPLFLTCGLFKPHSPFFAPPQWHRQLGALPQRLASDRADLPPGAHQLMKRKDWFWRGMQAVEQRQPGAWRDFVSSYVACAEFADAQLGRLLDAVDRSDRYRNAVLVLWSDHGFHLGEKDHIEKFALWEKTTHIPFVIVAPGVARANAVCDRPLDLSVLYPTLLELAGLPPDKSADGRSVVPLLRDPQRSWKEPAVMTYQCGNHAVRSERWRYIRYQDGTEELYDHTSDPHEWHNLAQPPHGKVRDEHRQVMDEHRQWLPASEATPVPNLKKG